MFTAGSGVGLCVRQDRGSPSAAPARDAVVKVVRWPELGRGLLPLYLQLSLHRGRHDVGFCAADKPEAAGARDAFEFAPVLSARPVVYRSRCSFWDKVPVGGGHLVHVVSSRTHRHSTVLALDRPGEDLLSIWASEPVVWRRTVGSAHGLARRVNRPKREY